ncbi:MAG TPA: murein biosynthesis integral membrane protein MurJ [Gammaproteobacteria bacterium]
MRAAEDRVAPRPERLLESTSVIGSMTLLSRVFGLVRDKVFSYAFGASPVMDAFIVAFKIPNLLRRFFAEGAFSAAFVPMLAEYRSERTPEEMRQLVDRIAGTLTVFLFAITAVGVIAAPALIAVFAPGFLDEADGRFELATAMLRLTFPYLFFISLTALAGGILNTFRRFAVPAFTPLLLNLVLILFALAVAPALAQPGLALALGVLVAGCVQLAFQLPFLARLGLLPRPRWGLGHPGVRRILALMTPVLFGSSVAQVNILFDTLIASFLAAGSISWLYYSDRLLEFPVGVFGIALATAILPSLSEQHARRSGDSFAATLDWALRLVLVIALPAAVGLAVLAEPLLATIFLGGEFGPIDVAMSAASLRAYAPGLLGFIAVKVLSPGYFARHDTRTPVRVGVQSLLVSFGLNVVFVLALVATGWAPAHAGLAAATSCAGLYNAALLLRGLAAARVLRPAPGWRRLAAQVIGACAAMIVFLLWGLDRAGDWAAMSGWQRAGMLALLVVGGAAVYAGAAYALGLRPRELRGARGG